MVELAKLDLWWNGLQCLFKDQKSWPQFVIEQNPECVTEEVKKSILVSREFRKRDSSGCVTMVSTDHIEGDTWRLSPRRYSNWMKYARVYAWVLRFVSNCETVKSSRIQDGELHVEEIGDATKDIFTTKRIHL